MTLTASTRGPVPLLIAFADLTRYAFQSLCVPDAELAETMDAFYERVASRIEAGGGTVVKFIGDATLAVFPADGSDGVDRGVETLLALKTEVDDFFASRGWECRLIVKAHVGTPIAGPYGGGSTGKRFDVLGKDVNAAAMLDSTGVTLSAEAFGKVSPALRARFKEHTPRVTYNRVEDVQRFRRK
jgi:adenylate cyclase